MYPKTSPDQSSTGASPTAAIRAPELSPVTPEPDRAGPGRLVKRVLLAESNSVSRNVALHILAKLGYQVDHVSNGFDALESVQRGAYDLVIVDTELPEMDGYALTGAIRKLADEARSRVPIIALTSSGAPSDRAQREAAGMNDYIVKPLRPGAVASVLARWDASAAAVAPPMAIDRDMLLSLVDLTDDRSPALLQELVELFHGSTPARLAELRLALKKRDAKRMREIAHTLYGSAGQLGAVRMAQTCTSIETLARTGSVKGTPELLDQLDLDFDRAYRDLQALAREGFAPGTASQPAPDRTALDLAALRKVLEGKRLIAVYAGRPIVAQVEAAFEKTDCRVEQVAASAADGSADLLFWGGDLDQLAALREKGLRTPVIVLLKELGGPVLDRLRDLNADFVVQPFRSGDLQLRAYLSLGTARTAARMTSDGTKPSEILVAEDDPLIARFLVTHLQGAGFHVTHVGDGDSALEELEKKRFDVAILDINMPKTDGFGVLSQLKLRPECQDMPVLMLSARVEEHDIVKAFDLGAEDYVTKPFNPLEVVSRVRRLARHH